MKQFGGDRSACFVVGLTGEIALFLEWKASKEQTPSYYVSMFTSSSADGAKLGSWICKKSSVYIRTLSF